MKVSYDSEKQRRGRGETAGRQKEKKWAEREMSDVSLPIIDNAVVPLLLKPLVAKQELSAPHTRGCQKYT